MTARSVARYAGVAGGMSDIRPLQLGLAVALSELGRDAERRRTVGGMAPLAHHAGGSRAG